MEEQQSKETLQTLLSNIADFTKRFNDFFKNNKKLLEGATNKLAHKKTQQKVFLENLASDCLKISAHINQNNETFQQVILHQYPTILLRANELLMALKIKSIKHEKKYSDLLLQFETIENAFKQSIDELLTLVRSPNKNEAYDQLQDQLKYGLQALNGYIRTTMHYVKRKQKSDQHKIILANYQKLVQDPLDKLNIDRVISMNMDYDPSDLVVAFTSIATFLNSINNKKQPIDPLLKLLQLLYDKGSSILISLKPLKEKYVAELTKRNGSSSHVTIIRNLPDTIGYSNNSKEELRDRSLSQPLPPPTSGTRTARAHTIINFPGKNSTEEAKTPQPSSTIPPPQ